MFWMTLIFITTTLEIQDFANDENMTTATAVQRRKKHIPAGMVSSDGTHPTNPS